MILWNINECGSHIKRRKILAYLKSQNTDTAHIQELLIMGDEEVLQFKKSWVGKVHHRSYSSKMNGVMIVINKNLSFVMIKQHNDIEGCFFCIEPVINGTKTILCHMEYMHQTKKEHNFFYMKLIQW